MEVIALKVTGPDEIVYDRMISFYHVLSISCYTYLLYERR